MAQDSKSVDEKDGDMLFHQGKEAIAVPDVQAAKQCFLDAAEAYRRAEALAGTFKAQDGCAKKQQLMLAMIKRIEATAAATSKKTTPRISAAAVTPTPAQPPAAKVPGAGPVPATEVKKKYSMDYSRFSQLDDSDDEETAAPAAQPAGGPPLDLYKRMPRKFLEAMRFNEEAQKRGCKPGEMQKAEKMFQDAFEEASPDVRDNIWEMLKAGGADLPTELKADCLGGSSSSLKTALAKAHASDAAKSGAAAAAEPVSSDPKAMESKLEKLKKSMQDDLQSLNEKMARMNQQEQALMGAKDFDDLASFMQQNGLSNAQIESALEAQEAGDEEAVQRILQNAIAQKLGTGSEVAIDDKIQQLDLIQDALEKGKVSAAAAATGEPEAAAAESKGAKKKATFSFYKQQDSGDGGAGGGVGVPSELSKKKADLEAAMESAKRELKGQEDMSVERSRQVERAKRELEDTERAKKEASRAVDEAVTQMVTKADDQEEGEGSDSAGQRKFLAEKEKDLGNKAFAGGDYGGAIEHFSRALKLAGPNCIYYTNRAAAYLRASRAAEALKDAEEAVCLDPQYVKALFRRAQALEALNQYTDAVAAYEHGLTVMPESDQLLQGLKSAQQKAEKVSAETKNSSSAASASSPAPASASSAPATSPAPAGGASSDATERDGYVPEYRIEETDEHLVVYVELPDRDHIRGVDLQLFSDSLSLTATPFAPLVLSLPHAVDYEAAKAKFVKKTKTLKITIPRA